MANLFAANAPAKVELVSPKTIIQFGFSFKNTFFQLRNHF